MAEADSNVVAMPRGPKGLVALRDLPESPPREVWYSGFPEFRKRMQIGPKTLAVATGHPGHGKTSFMANLIFNTASTHGLGVVVATFETQPMADYRKLLRQFWAGLPETQMNDKQRREADDFIHDHYRFLMHPDERPNLEWILEWTVKANAFDLLVIDPWNRLESQREKDETETEYIAWCLTELRKFAIIHNCFVLIIAHPAKAGPQFRGRWPCLEDISGSKHWDNMPDQGFCVHRDTFWDKSTGARKWNASVYHLKARFEELGHPCQFDMRLNPQTWRFETAAKNAPEDA